MRLVDTLRWPVAALIVTGSVHLAAEAVLPDLRSDFGPASLAPLFLVYGLWVGSAAITDGASLGVAVVAGLVLGALPLALDVLGFGILLGRGTQSGLVSGVFGLLTILFGTLAGASWATSQAASRGSSRRAG
jgi:hypothetical protein